MKTSILKIIFALLPVILVGIATLYLSGVFGNSIPDFTVERLDGRTYTQNNIRPDVPTVLCYIDVNCEECNSFIDEIIANANSFTKSEVVIISPQGPLMLKGFQHKKNFKKYPFITLLNDKYKNFDLVVKAQRFPTVLVYNSSQSLEIRFDNLTSKTQTDEAVKKIIELIKEK